MLPRRDSKPIDQPALLPMFGGMEKKPRFLDREVITMGRARGSDFCLDGNEVSALHCIIYRSAEGFRVRDCGSRTGTRVNGQGTKNTLLGNGDVLQIGPFSFEVRIPKGLETSASLDPTKVERLKRSRSHLIHLALRLRKKLIKNPHNGHASNNGTNLTETHPLDKKALDLKAKMKHYDQKVNELEEAEKELFDDKELLKKQRREFEELMRNREADYLRRNEALTVAEAKKKSQVTPALSPEQLYELQSVEAKKKELEALEKKLKARDKELNDDYKEIQKERDQLEKARQHWEQEQVEARKEFEKHQETLSSAEFTLHDQKSQLGAMIDQLKKMQDELRATAQGESVQLHEQIVQLKKDLAEARASKGGNAGEAQQLRDKLAAAQAEVKVLSQSLQQTKGFSGEVEALQKEMLAAQARLQDQVRTLEAENDRLRTVASQAEEAAPAADDPRFRQLEAENEELRKLANELEQRFTAEAQVAAQVEVLKNENESLRILIAKTEQDAAPAAATDNDEIRQENQVLRRLLEEAETELNKHKGAMPMSRDSEQIRNENVLLHKLLAEKDKMMEELHQMASNGGGGGDSPDVEKLKNELRVVQDLLREKDNLIEELKEEASKMPGSDPESYEAELNRFRKELEADRVRLNKEIESLRQRNSELDDATREMEMELSRERAEMARERIRIDRMREEVKADLERLQREHEVRGTLGSVQKLREEIVQKSVGGPPKSAADRLRTMSKLP